MKKTVWMSYDLGITGDYKNLYYWLDERQAKECGDGVAVFVHVEKKDVGNEIRLSLKKSIKIDPQTRIYVIYRKKKPPGGDEPLTGTFLFGRRKSAPWTGAASGETVDEEVHGDRT
jgi:hypothetical protein